MKLFLLVLIFISDFCFAQDINLKKLLEETRQETNIPALAASIISSHGIQNEVIGTNKINGNHQVQLTDKFHLGSNTKAFTAFIAMKLVEQGKLSLTTSLYDLYPELKEINPKFNDLTLDNLLSHNARIPAFTSGLAFLMLPKFEGNIIEKRYKFVKHILTYKPIKKGTYSNADYAIIAMMIDKVSNKSFEDELIATMQKLGLEFFLGFPNKESIDNPWGHINSFFQNKPLPPDDEYKLEDYIAAAGDLSMNIVDYAQFIQMNLKGLRGQNNYLTTQSYQKLHFGRENYAYGWGNKLLENKKVSYHDGSAATFYCHTVVMPDDDLAIVIMMNSAKSNQIKGLYKLRKKLVQLKKRERKNAKQ